MTPSPRPSRPPSGRSRRGPARCPCSRVSGCSDPPGRSSWSATDLELTIRVQIPADTEGEGSAVVPARLFSEIVRQLDGRRRCRWRWPATTRRSRPGGLPRRCARWPRTSSPGCRSRARAGVRVEAGRVRRGVAPGGARRVARRCPADPHRRAAHRVGRRIAPGRDRLLPARGARPAGLSACWTRARRCSSRPRAWARSSGCSRADRRDRGGARRARGRVPRRARTEVTTRLIEGDFPNYEQLIPSGYPNRLTVAREALRRRP